MRYSKAQVNEIVNKILDAVKATDLGAENNADFQYRLEMIREEHLLVDRRKSSIPEYRNDILRDFMDVKRSYKDIMRKYKCSMRTLRSLLDECAEDDPRVAEEIELRRHHY